jgi:hypothetical protein
LNRHFSKGDIQMANGYVETHVIWLILRKMQIKTTVNLGQNVYKGEHLYTVDNTVNWCSHFGKMYGDWFLETKNSFSLLKIEMRFINPITGCGLQGIKIRLRKRRLDFHPHCSVMHSIQDIIHASQFTRCLPNVAEHTGVGSHSVAEKSECPWGVNQFRKESGDSCSFFSFPRQII